ncbi:MAG: DUF1501 domain-containing protein [Planctomycetes bacterium]|nr:DUF1501 domain-containing protein [Planctomycetota bacterium]
MDENHDDKRGDERGIRCNRREVLAGALALPMLPCGFRAPGFLQEPAPAARSKNLVVIELAGGNDAINTVVPHSDPEYARARPTLAIRRGLHPIDERVSLHPALARLSALHAANEAATLLGVGYPDPDRSHFRSMDIWQSGRTDVEDPRLGVFGLAADVLHRRGATLPAIALGISKRPLGLAGRSFVAPALTTLVEHRLELGDVVPELEHARERALDDRTEPDVGDDALDRLIKKTARQAYGSARTLRQLAAKRPGGGTAATFEAACALAADVLTSSIGVRIVWLRLSGFDTHAGQARVHGPLLAELDRGIGTLRDMLDRGGAWQTTRVVVFSEFGRRVAENRSRGTDHGAAGHVFLIGRGLRSGVHGDVPSLVDLERGDLRHAFDFRRLYAELLESWLDVPPLDAGVRAPASRFLT